MAEERGMIIGDRVETRLDGIENRMSRLDGGFDQMNKRVENIERAVTQIQWSLVSGFLITILAVILTRLLR